MQFITKQIGLLAGALVLIAGVTTANAERGTSHRCGTVGRLLSPLRLPPYWRAWHPYAYTYAYPVLPDASIRTKVDPHDTEIFVDGYSLVTRASSTAASAFA